jgi:hypothetical protein
MLKILPVLALDLAKHMLASRLPGSSTLFAIPVRCTDERYRALASHRLVFEQFSTGPARAAPPLLIPMAGNMDEADFEEAALLGGSHSL